MFNKITQATIDEERKLLQNKLLILLDFLNRLNVNFTKNKNLLGIEEVLYWVGYIESAENNFKDFIKQFKANRKDYSRFKNK